MADRSRARRSRARYLAPVALAATIAGTYVVVHDTLNAKKSTSTSQSATRPQTTPAVSHHKAATAAKFYVVKPGDNPSSISAKTGVALTTIESLNHNLNPNALQTGQRLRLRR